MKRLWVLLPLFVLTACPYESPVPVDEPNIAIDTALFGKWKHIDEEKSYASVSRQSDHCYRMVYNSWPSEHRSYHVKMFTTHVSVLSGSYFLNVQPDMKTGGSYYISELNVNPGKDTLTLRPVSDEHRRKFSNSVEFREWILKKMKKKDFFDKKELFVRVP